MPGQVWGASRERTERSIEDAAAQPVAPPATRRADAGVVSLTGRDIADLIWCGEMHGVPYDLLASLLAVRDDRLRAITGRWRKAGYAQTARLGPGPAWCWLTRPGLAAAGLDLPATAPSPGRLAHLRAVAAVRLSLETGPAWAEGHAHWRSERKIRHAMGGKLPARARPRRGSVLARRARLPVPRRDVGHRGRADPQAVSAHRRDHARAARPDHRVQPRLPPRRDPRYARVVYLTAPPAAPVCRRHAPARPGRPGHHPRPAARGAAVTIWWLIRLRLAMWALTAAWKVTKWAVAAAVLVAALPVTLVTAAGLARAWLHGWPPARL
jgi:hypothetical protein